MHWAAIYVRASLSPPSLMLLSPLVGGTDAHWQQEDLPPRGVGGQGHEHLQGLPPPLTQRLFRSRLTLCASTSSTTSIWTASTSDLPSPHPLLGRYTCICIGSFLLLYQGIRCIVVEFLSMCARAPSGVVSYHHSCPRPASALSPPPPPGRCSFLIVHTHRRGAIPHPRCRRRPRPGRGPCPRSTRAPTAARPARPHVADRCALPGARAGGCRAPFAAAA